MASERCRTDEESYGSNCARDSQPWQRCLPGRRTLLAFLRCDLRLTWQGVRRLCGAGAGGCILLRHKHVSLLGCWCRGACVPPNNPAARTDISPDREWINACFLDSYVRRRHSNLCVDRRDRECAQDIEGSPMTGLGRRSDSCASYSRLMAARHLGSAWRRCTASEWCMSGRLGEALSEELCSVRRSLSTAAALADVPTGGAFPLAVSQSSKSRPDSQLSGLLFALDLPTHT